ncbi:MAG: hypothetical protein DME32_00310 [Verrucomicrobia bacterium]|nr:MAG: hypothetical protein DME32_00310 [Verrucomicrobiota bacterium]
MASPKTIVTVLEAGCSKLQAAIEYVVKEAASDSTIYRRLDHAYYGAEIARRLQTAYLQVRALSRVDPNFLL